MKRLIISIGIIMFLMAGTVLANAQQEKMGQQKMTDLSAQMPMTGSQATMPEQGGGWFCPYCGQQPFWGMHGYMHGRRMGMAPQSGMMRGQEQVQAISKDDARNLVDNYIKRTNNPNLKLGNITEQPQYFVADITTKDGSLVDRLEIDKHTGWFRSVYSH